MAWNYSLSLHLNVTATVLGKGKQCLSQVKEYFHSAYNNVGNSIISSVPIKQG